MGSVAGIVIGNMLGAEEYDRARSASTHLMALSFTACTLMGLGLLAAAPVAPRFYNTTPEIMVLASRLMRVCAVMLPLNALTNVEYWTIRAGGRTYITMLFDSVFTWVVLVPLAWMLIHRTALPLLSVYIVVSSSEILKTIIGMVLVRKGIWVQNIVGSNAV